LARLAARWRVGKLLMRIILTGILGGLLTAFLI
jgi:hypothetical protein